MCVRLYSCVWYSFFTISFAYLVSNTTQQSQRQQATYIDLVGDLSGFRKVCKMKCGNVAIELNRTSSQFVQKHIQPCITDSQLAATYFIRVELCVYIYIVQSIVLRNVGPNLFSYVFRFERIEYTHCGVQLSTTLSTKYTSHATVSKTFSCLCVTSYTMQCAIYKEIYTISTSRQSFNHCTAKFSGLTSSTVIHTHTHRPAEPLATDHLSLYIERHTTHAHEHEHLRNWDTLYGRMGNATLPLACGTNAVCNDVKSEQRD